MENTLKWERGFKGYINCLKEIEEGCTGRNITKRLYGNIRQMVDAVGSAEVEKVGVTRSLIKKACKF